MNIAVILAGGVGVRMELGNEPKQFVLIDNMPVIVHTLKTFEEHPKIDVLVIVTLPEWIDYLNDVIDKYKISKVKFIVNGGSTRQESVYNAINILRTRYEKNDIVLIHDSVRPLVSKEIITDNIEMTEKFGAVVTCIPSSDTILKSYEGKFVSEVPNRSTLYQAQTPQSFKLSLILQAHEVAIKNNDSNFTDDTQLVLNINKPVHLVNGSKLNFKITLFEDLQLFEALVKMNLEYSN